MGLNPTLNRNIARKNKGRRSSGSHHCSDGHVDVNHLSTNPFMLVKGDRVLAK